MATALAGKRLPRSERQLEREESILSAAREALADKGYDGVTMNALAEKAGVVKKTLYNLYGSKDALLLAAVSEVISGYRGEAARAEPGIPAIVANRGKRVVPHLRESRTPLVNPQSRDPVEIGKAHFDKVIRGLWMSVNRQGTLLAFVAGSSSDPVWKPRNMGAVSE